MSGRAWAFVGTVILTGVVLSGLTWPISDLSASGWLTFVALTVLATITQLQEAEAPSRQSYYPHLVFFFAGTLLLPPSLFILLVTIPHLVEWTKKRLLGSPLLRDWYIQPFNISMHIIAGTLSRWLYSQLDVQMALHSATVSHFTMLSVLSVMVAALVYLAVNHLIIGQVLVLARGVSWRESGVLDPENLMTDLVLLLLGYVVAVLWALNPWLTLPALSPLVLIHRALMIPKLKQEARIDAKTGVWNIRHFTELFEKEMERARRFNRPLAFIMADLDLLRNINNTYGHLAGDAVLMGIGQIIRETLREYDIAGRFGGEEFAICLPETDRFEAYSIAERVRQAIESASFEVSTSLTPIQATMSLGVACFPEDAHSSRDLVHEADVAVYQAKLQGRNRVVMAVDVPHYIKLEGMVPEDRLEGTYSIAYVARPEFTSNHPTPEPDTDPRDRAGRAEFATAGETAAPAAHQANHGSSKSAGYHSTWVLSLFVIGVIMAGVIVTALGILAGWPPDKVAIALLVALAAITELTQVDLYGDGSISVSLAVNFAAALIAGMPGVVAVSTAISLAHCVRVRPALYKTAFNWATHVLAGSAPALTMWILGTSMNLSVLPELLAPTVIASIAYYAIETGLIAAAVSLSEGRAFMATWHSQYQWLMYHYLVLCIMGLFLGVAYPALGPLGVVVFVLPVFMMRFAQQQYVERTEDSVQELKRMNWELAQANKEVVSASQAIRQLNDELFMTLAKIIDARDPYVSGHAAQVAKYATAIAMELELPSERVESVRQAAFLHDIGKIGISEQILHKPTDLTDDEYDYIKSHVTLGAEFLETSQGLRHLARFTRYHHERWDGKGYPDGLQGEEIPVEARILAVSDAVEAMVSDRPYHRAMSLNNIIDELRECAGTQFDPRVVEAFVRVVEREGPRFVINSAREVARKYTGHSAGDLTPFKNAWMGILR